MRPSVMHEMDDERSSCVVQAAVSEARSVGRVALRQRMVMRLRKAQSVEEDLVMLLMHGHAAADKVRGGDVE